MAIKQVTCGLSAVKRAASNEGIILSYGCPPGTLDVHADVTVRQMSHEQAVVLASRTLAGDLFLSLLVCGAIG